LSLAAMNPARMPFRNFVRTSDRVGLAMGREVILLQATLLYESKI
jgi:hypothetical protein